MASGNSAQSGAHQQNVAFQFCFYQRNVYHITINTQTSSDSKRDDVNLRIRAYEQIIHREASVLAKYAKSLDSLINGHLHVNADTLDPYYLLFIAKRLLDTQTKVLLGSASLLLLKIVHEQKDLSKEHTSWLRITGRTANVYNLLRNTNLPVLVAVKALYHYYI
ncbi:hypothetical protein TgHK011_002494 [Trichoderma gracile]|nr:hypothetical protein TgHK011_002494 [Trichoderma gracile]